MLVGNIFKIISEQKGANQNINTFNIVTQVLIAIGMARFFTFNPPLRPPLFKNVLHLVV
jgi:hypothetical protein